jgi:hypothetical protein
MTHISTKNIPRAGNKGQRHRRQRHSLDDTARIAPVSFSLFVSRARTRGRSHAAIRPPHPAMSCHVMSYHIMSCHVISYHVMSCGQRLYHTLCMHREQGVRAAITLIITVHFHRNTDFILHMVHGEQVFMSDKEVRAGCIFQNKWLLA